MFGTNAPGLKVMSQTVQCRPSSSRSCIGSSILRRVKSAPFVRVKAYSTTVCQRCLHVPVCLSKSQETSSGRENEASSGTSDHGCRCSVCR